MHAAIWGLAGMGTETKAAFLSDEVDMTQGDQAGCDTVRSPARVAQRGEPGDVGELRQGRHLLAAQ